jgi:methylated-DNA-protein-cysteine methyltransferase-like protein
MTTDQTKLFERIYAAVRRIPNGQVATYGQIGRLVTGTTTAARTVGWALHGLPAARVDEVPWWRVINARGRISNSQAHRGAAEQRRRLEAEGVRFDADGRVDLGVYRWDADFPDG